MQIPEPVRYRKKETLSITGMLRYRAETSVSGMPMSATSLNADAQLRYYNTTQNIDLNVVNLYVADRR
jgi:hypothetical protein